MKVHIGKLIKEAVKTSGMSVTEFAKKINYSRRNIYSIFDKESIDTGLLVKIGNLLKRDFFAYYHPPGPLASEPSGEKEYKEGKIKELQKEIEYLKEINALLRAQVEKLSKGKKKKAD